MASNLPPELANLPPPRVIEIISFGARYQALRTKLTEIFAAVGIDYDVENLETDPAQIILQAGAYQEIGLRQRVNDAVQSYFLAFAEGSDVDALGQWYDTTRLPSETDDAFKRRIILEIQSRSPGGTEPRYKAIALGADVRVADAAVYRDGKDPTIHVAIFSTDNFGVPTPDLLAKVNAALQDPAKRMVNDTIVVAGAARQAQPIVANYWLLPDAATTTDQTMKTSLQTAWARDMGLGRDLVPSWILSALQVGGVQRVELVTPPGLVPIESNRAAALGTITLNFMGRDY